MHPETQIENVTMSQWVNEKEGESEGGSERVSEKWKVKSEKQCFHWLEVFWVQVTKEIKEQNESWASRRVY